jgi:hypothetical protein
MRSYIDQTGGSSVPQFMERVDELTGATRPRPRNPAHRVDGPRGLVVGMQQYEQRRVVGADCRFDQSASRDAASASHRRTAALRRIEKS